MPRGLGKGRATTPVAEAPAIQVAHSRRVQCTPLDTDL